MYSFFQDISHFRIILGSQSPRRKQLLEMLGIRFEVVEHTYDEHIPSGLFREQAAMYVADKKLNRINEFISASAIVITADTIVCLGNEILGKPEHEQAAIEMLKKLSGRMHEVFTGVCVANAVYRDTFSVQSQVWFKHLTDDEISFYVRHFRPYDKAGSYGVQDWLGLTGIEKIAGSFYNVMGLPVKEVYESMIRIIRAVK